MKKIPGFLLALLLLLLASSFALVVVIAQSSSPNNNNPISSSSEIIPLYISKQLQNFASFSTLFSSSTNKFINRKPISDVNLFWRDTVGSAMLDLVQPISVFPTATQDSFFRARQHAQSMPFAYSPVCVAVNVKYLSSASYDNFGANRTDKMESEFFIDHDSPMSLNQLAAWLSGNSSILTATGESSHPIFSHVTKIAVSKKSAIGAVVVDALQQYSTSFPDLPKNVQQSSLMNVWPTEIGTSTSNSKIVWYESDNDVDEQLAMTTTTNKIGEVPFGFTLFSSSVALNRPSNNVRCIPLLDPLFNFSSSSTSNKKHKSASVSNASHINAELLEVKYQDISIENQNINLPFVVRRKYLRSSSSTKALLYPLIALLSLNVDTRTFTDCSERAIAIQDLYFNLTFVDGHMLKRSQPRSSSSSSLSTTTTSERIPSSASFPAAQNLPSPHQPYWPWTHLSLITRNNVRLALLKTSKRKVLTTCSIESDLKKVKTTFLSPVHQGRAPYSFPFAKSSPEFLASAISLSELYFTDLVNHPLQGRVLRGAADDSLPVSNIFERPVLVIFSPAADNDNDDKDFPLSFQTSESNTPQQYTLPKISSASKNNNQNQTSSNVVTTPLGVSQTCVIYNSDNLFVDNLWNVSSSSASYHLDDLPEIPHSLNIPICILMELLSLNSRELFWNDARILESNPQLRQHIDGLDLVSSKHLKFVSVFSQQQQSLSSVNRHLNGASEYCGISNLTTHSSVPTSTNNNNILSVENEHQLIETLLNTPGSISLVPCSLSSPLVDAGLLHRAHLVLDPELSSSSTEGESHSSVELESPSDLMYLITTQKRLFMSLASSSSSSFDSSTFSDNATSLLAHMLFDQVLGLNPSVFSVQSASLKDKASKITSTTTSTSSSFSCQDLFSSARFLEWILSAGVGLDVSLMSEDVLNTISSRMFPTMDGSSSSASSSLNASSSITPSFALSHSSSAFAPFDVELINIALDHYHQNQQEMLMKTATDIVSTEFFSKITCVNEFDQLVSSYRAIPPPLPGRGDPAKSLTFQVGFPLGIIFAIAAFIVFIYFAKKAETDDTQHAPVNAKRPIFIVCVHVPLKEHLRSILGNEKLDKWLEMYRKHVRKAAQKAEVYVVKEGENSGFFLASKAANNAVEFAFSLHESLLEFSEQEMSHEEHLELQKAYDRLKGPFSRFFAQAAPIRRNFRTAENLNFPMNFEEERKKREAAEAAANAHEFEKGNRADSQQQQQKQQQDYYDEDEFDEATKMQREDPSLWTGLLVSVGVEVGPCDIHFISDSEGFEYSGIPVEHADSLALIAAPGQTLVSEEVMRSITRWYDLKRIGKVTCLGDVDLGVMLPVKELFGGTATLVDSDYESEELNEEERKKRSELQIVTEADIKYEEKMRIIAEERAREKRAKDRLARLQKRYVNQATEKVLVDNLEQQMSDIPTVLSAAQSMTDREIIEAQMREEDNNNSKKSSRSRDDYQQQQQHGSNYVRGGAAAITSPNSKFLDIPRASSTSPPARGDLSPHQAPPLLRPPPLYTTSSQQQQQQQEHESDSNASLGLLMHHRQDTNKHHQEEQEREKHHSSSSGSSTPSSSIQRRGGLMDSFASAGQQQQQHQQNANQGVSREDSLARSTTSASGHQMKFDKNNKDSDDQQQQQHELLRGGGPTSASTRERRVTLTSPDSGAIQEYSREVTVESEDEANNEKDGRHNIKINKTSIGSSEANGDSSNGHHHHFSPVNPLNETQSPRPLPNVNNTGSQNQLPGRSESNNNEDGFGFVSTDTSPRNVVLTRKETRMGTEFGAANSSNNNIPRRHSTTVGPNVVIGTAATNQSSGVDGENNNPPPHFDDRATEAPESAYTSLETSGPQHFLPRVKSVDGEDELDKSENHGDGEEEEAENENEDAPVSSSQTRIVDTKKLGAIASVVDVNISGQRSRARSVVDLYFPIPQSGRPASPEGNAVVLSDGRNNNNNHIGDHDDDLVQVIQTQNSSGSASATQQPNQQHFSRHHQHQFQTNSLATHSDNNTNPSSFHSVDFARLNSNANMMGGGTQNSTINNNINLNMMYHQNNSDQQQQQHHPSAAAAAGGVEASEVVSNESFSTPGGKELSLGKNKLLARSSSEAGLGADGKKKTKKKGLKRKGSNMSQFAMSSRSPLLTPLSGTGGTTGSSTTNQMLLAMESSGLLNPNNPHTSSSIRKAQQHLMTMVAQQQQQQNAQNQQQQQNDLVSREHSFNNDDNDLLSMSKRSPGDPVLEEIQKKMNSVLNKSLHPVDHHDISVGVGAGSPGEGGLRTAAEFRQQIHELRQLEASLHMPPEEKERLNRLRTQVGQQSTLIRQKFEKRKTTIYSILPYGLKKRVFPPPRDIKDAKDRTLTEPISRLLNQLLYKQDLDRIVHNAQKDTVVDKKTGKSRRRSSRFHYELVEDPASLVLAEGNNNHNNNNSRDEMEEEGMASFKFPVSPALEGEQEQEQGPASFEDALAKQEEEKKKTKPPAPQTLGRRGSLRIAKKPIQPSRQVLLPPSSSSPNHHQNHPTPQDALKLADSLFINKNKNINNKEKNKKTSRDSLNNNNNDSPSSRNSSNHSASSPVKYLGGDGGGGADVTRVYNNSNSLFTRTGEDDKKKNTSTAITVPPLSPLSLQQQQQNPQTSNYNNNSLFSHPPPLFTSKVSDHPQVTSSLTGIGRDKPAPPPGSLVKNVLSSPQQKQKSEQQRSSFNQRLTSQMQQRKPIAIEHRPSWNSSIPPPKIVRNNNTVNNKTNNDTASPQQPPNHEQQGQHSNNSKRNSTTPTVESSTTRSEQQTNNDKNSNKVDAVNAWTRRRVF